MKCPYHKTEVSYRTKANGCTEMYCYMCELGGPRKHATKTELDAIDAAVRAIAEPLWAEFDKQQKKKRKKA